MNIPVLPKLDFLTSLPDAAEVKPQAAAPACLQEQFTGLLPVRSERPMAEILAERLAQADPANPSPVFIP